MRLLAASLLMALGCAQLEPDPSKCVPAPVFEYAAVGIALESFGVDASPSHRPEIFWYGPAGLDCAGGRGFTCPTTGRCDGGCTLYDRMIVALPDLGAPIDDTPIVHELAHWVWYDPGHGNRVIWGDDLTSNEHIPGNRVGDANIAIRAANLH